MAVKFLVLWLILRCFQVESLSRELLVVHEAQHHQQFVDGNKKKNAASQQHEMMSEAYKRERDGMYHKCIHIHTCVYMYAHTCMHTHTHTHAHTQIIA